MSEDYPRRECEHAISNAVSAAMEPMNTKLDEIYRRMFVDNGKKSIQSSLSAMNGHMKFQYALLGLLIAGLLGIAWKAVLAGLL